VQFDQIPSGSGFVFQVPTAALDARFADVSEDDVHAAAE
jgi:hypothetical protein